jgi:SAM-dependent methyltransferase
MDEPLDALEDKPCPLGCARDDKTLFVATDRLHGLPGSFPVVQCRTCRLIRTNPRPRPDAMAAYYPDDYGPHHSAIRDHAPQQRWNLRRCLTQSIDYRATSLPPTPPGRALEIGCASGSFLDELRAGGWTASGLEASPLAAARATALGFDVAVTTLEGAAFDGFEFDLIVAWMVIEHLHDPVAALRKVRQWTAPHGWLAASTPNAGSVERRLFRNSWYALQVPTHLYHFTPQTLRNVLMASGWSVERVAHQRVLGNVIGSVGNALAEVRWADRLASRLRRLPESGRRVNVVLYPVGVALAAIGQTGRMTVWARASC